MDEPGEPLIADEQEEVERENRVANRVYQLTYCENGKEVNYDNRHGGEDRGRSVRCESDAKLAGEGEVWFYKLPNPNHSNTLFLWLAGGGNRTPVLSLGS